jgi:cell shape-determining protein MreD
MFKKIWRIIFFVLLLSGLAGIQLSLIFTLPDFFRQINLILIALIFTLFFFGFRAAVWAAIIGGFWLDLFSFSFFGLYLITLFLTALLTEKIANTWLTNRSLYSFLLLILAATVGYNMIFGILSYFSSNQAVFFLTQSNFWQALAYQGVWSLAAGLLMFNLAGAATRWLKPVFLKKS